MSVALVRLTDVFEDAVIVPAPVRELPPQLPWRMHSVDCQEQGLRFVCGRCWTEWMYCRCMLVTA